MLVVDNCTEHLLVCLLNVQRLELDSVQAAEHGVVDAGHGEYALVEDVVLSSGLAFLYVESLAYGGVVCAELGPVLASLPFPKCIFYLSRKGWSAYTKVI